MGRDGVLLPALLILLAWGVGAQRRNLIQRLIQDLRNSPPARPNPSPQVGSGTGHLRLQSDVRRPVESARPQLSQRRADTRPSRDEVDHWLSGLQGHRLPLRRQPVDRASRRQGSSSLGRGTRRQGGASLERDARRQESSSLDRVASRQETTQDRAARRQGPPSLPNLLMGLRRGSSEVIASIIPGKKTAMTKVSLLKKQLRKKHSSRKPEDKSKFKPPSDISHGFEPFFRESPAFDESSLVSSLPPPSLASPLPSIPHQSSASSLSLAVTAQTSPRPLATPRSPRPLATPRSPRPSATPSPKRQYDHSFKEQSRTSLYRQPEKQTAAPKIFKKKFYKQSKSPTKIVTERKDLTSLTPFNEDIFHESSNIAEFFSGVEDTFPELEALGVGWESSKLASWRQAVLEEEEVRKGGREEGGRVGRRRREAYDQPFYYSPEPVRRGGQRQQQARQDQWRQRYEYGPREAGDSWERPRERPRERYDIGAGAGFWEEDEFNTDFFSSPASQQPLPQAQTSYQLAYQQAQEARNKRRPDYRPHGQYDRYDVEENEILGSGNFDIVKGGTFYQSDDYQYRYNSNKPAPTYNYYGGNDYFENFRDFADIKGKAKQQRY